MTLKEIKLRDTLVDIVYAVEEEPYPHHSNSDLKKLIIDKVKRLVKIDRAVEKFIKEKNK